MARPSLDRGRADPRNPDPYQSGRVSSIAVDPRDTSRWLIGAGNGGVWETRDAGRSWTPIADDAPTLSIGVVTFAPGNPDVIYVGTGEYVGTSPSSNVGVGILKSVNGGQSWALMGQSSLQSDGCPTAACRSERCQRRCGGVGNGRLRSRTWWPQCRIGVAAVWSAEVHRWRGQLGPHARGSSQRIRGRPHKLFSTICGDLQPQTPTSSTQGMCPTASIDRPTVA